MTISRTLLLAFLMLVLLPSVSLTGLSFLQSRRALHREIGTNLHDRARTLIQQIDALVFERLENAWSWSRLDVMQQAQVKDVDKRLSDFLRHSQQSYGGVYHELLFLDPDGRIVASSEAGHIGQRWQPGHLAWHDVRFVGGHLAFGVRRQGAGAAAARLVLRVPVDSRFTGKPLGSFYALLDWSQIVGMLDRAAGTSGRLALLLDARHRVLGHSAAAAGFTAGMPIDPPPVRHADPAFTRDGLGPLAGQFLVSEADSTGYRNFPGTGWQVLLAVPTRSAFAPVWRLLQGMAGLLVFTSALTALVALLIARRFSGPIEQLADFARRYDTNHQARLPAPAGSREIRELNQAFANMMDRLRRSSEQLVQAAKLATVGEMAATLAHEIRTPLGILNSSAQLLAEDDSLGPEGREMVDFIRAETRRLNGLVTTLLECARPRPPVFQPILVDRLLAEVVELLQPRAARKDIRLQVERTTDDTTIEADPDQCKQVLLNLVLNAIQILPAGGRVTLTVGRDGSDGIQIEVADDGPGIPEQDRRRIFEPFFSRREGGFGLGLSVVQQIVQAHGGRIEVDRSPLGGARFRIHLPLRQPTGASV